MIQKTPLRGHGRTFRELRSRSGKVLGVRVRGTELARLEALATTLPRRSWDYRENTATCAARRIIEAALADEKWLAKSLLKPA